MRPEHVVNAGIHTLTWGERQVEIRIDRLREKGGHVHGEMVVRTTLPGVDRHLHHSSVNLSSTTAKRALVKVLGEKVAHLPWADMIEQACVLVLRKHREGEPVIKLAELPPMERVKYRVAPPLHEGEPNLLYGPGGSGKSIIASFLAVLVDGPFPEGDNRVGFDPEPGNVLYLDYEASAYEIQDRLALLRLGMDADTRTEVLYRFCSQPLADDIEEIQRIVTEQGIDLLIVDSVGPACGGEPESADVVLRYFRALRSLRCTTLSIDHVTKDSEGRGRLPFGSVYKWNAARNIWEVSKVQDDEESEIHIGLFHRKVNAGKLLRPVGLKVTFTDGAIHVAREDVRNIPEFGGRLSLKEQIRGLMQSNGPMTDKELAAELGKPDNFVRSYLYKYRQMFIRISQGEHEGKWAIKSHENVPPH